MPVNGYAQCLVSPHAAYDYTGDIMVKTLCEATKRSIDDIVILAPCLRENDDFVYLSESELFKTPLGDSLLNTSLINQLQDCGTRIQKNDIPHLEAHAIEVQLPILQFMYPAARITPILIGSKNQQIAEMLAKALATVLHDKGDSTLIIVAMNLTDTLKADMCRQEVDTILSLIKTSEVQDRAKEILRLSSRGSAALYTALRYFQISGINLTSNLVETSIVELENKAVGYGGLFYT